MNFLSLSSIISNDTNKVITLDTTSANASPVIVGGESSDTTSTTGGTATATSTAPSMGSSVGIMVLYIVFIIVVFYFIAIRPQKKREKQLIELQSGIVIGDSILLESGMYGKVTDITNMCYIVEIGMNKGVLVPILKQRVISKGEPDLSVTKLN